MLKEKIYIGEDIFNTPLKVTYYARVSTDSDEQLNSLENQITYFENYIKENKNWTFIKGYIDEGLSGSTVSKRKEFLRMIEDAKAGLFDLIITKEVSRFSRNLADSIRYTRLLLEYNVGVFFQTNGINTFDSNSEFILNMMASLAQEEVKRLSLRVKWGHKNAIKRGRILGSNNITGYDKKDSILTINEEEAYKVKMIYTMYVVNKYGLNKLSQELFKLNIKNSLDKPYDKETLKRIIRNPKYKGYYRGHTTEVVDYRLKKRKIISEADQLIYKDENIPPIVSEELWNEANYILDKRSNEVKARRVKQSINPYTNKIFCKEHLSPYYKKTYRKKTTIYACSNYLKNGLSSCNSPIIKEDDLNNIIRKIIINILSPYQNKITVSLLEVYNKIPKDNQSKNLTNLNQKKEKLLELYLSNDLSKEEFKMHNDSYNKKINEILLSQKYKNNITLESTIKDFFSFEDISQYIPYIIEKIIVIHDDDDERKHIKLNIFLPVKASLKSFVYQSKNKSYYVDLFYAKK